MCRYGGAPHTSVCLLGADPKDQGQVFLVNGDGYLGPLRGNKGPILDLGQGLQYLV
jgi:hypothetical protein